MPLWFKWCNLLADDFFMGWGGNMSDSAPIAEKGSIWGKKIQILYWFCLTPRSNQHFMWKYAAWENEWSAYGQSLTTVLVILKQITSATDVKYLKYHQIRFLSESFFSCYCYFYCITWSILWFCFNKKLGFCFDEMNQLIIYIWKSHSVEKGQILTLNWYMCLVIIKKNGF